MILDLGIKGPDFRAIILEERVADEEFFTTVAIDISRVGIMSRTTVSVPESPELRIEYPEVGVAILQKEVIGATSAPQIGEESESPRMRGNFAGFFSSGMATGVGCLSFNGSRRTVGHDDFLIHRIDDFGFPVAVDVMDLHGDVIGEVIFPDVGFAELPENFPSVVSAVRQLSSLKRSLGP